MNEFVAITLLAAFAAIASAVLKVYYDWRAAIIGAALAIVGGLLGVSVANDASKEWPPVAVAVITGSTATLAVIIANQWQAEREAAALRGTKLEELYAEVVGFQIKVVSAFIAPQQSYLYRKASQAEARALVDQEVSNAPLTDRFNLLAGLYFPTLGTALAEFVMACSALSKDPDEFIGVDLSTLTEGGLVELKRRLGEREVAMMEKYGRVLALMRRHGADLGLHKLG